MFPNFKFGIFCFCGLILGVVSNKRDLRLLKARVNLFESRLSSNDQDITDIRDELKSLNNSMSEIEDNMCKDITKSNIGVSSNPSEYEKNKVMYNIFSNGFKKHKTWTITYINGMEETMKEEIKQCERKSEEAKKDIDIHVQGLVQYNKEVITNLVSETERLNSRIIDLERQNSEITTKLTQENEGLKTDLVHLLQEIESLKTGMAHLAQENKDSAVKVYDLTLKNQQLWSGLNSMVCHEGWEKMGISCYLFVNDTMQFWRAKSFCEDFGAYLVEIDNEDENLFVRNLTGGERTFIGLTKRDGQWIWDGSEKQTSYTNWLPGQPNNNGDNQECTEMGFKVPSEKWNDIGCDIYNHFVCEIQVINEKVQLNILTKTVTDLGRSISGLIQCPDGWTSWSTSCYMFEDTNMTFSVARSFCSNLGARMIDIQSEEENKFASNLSLRKRTWVGITDSEVEGAWKLENGNNATYINWRSGQPDGAGGNQDCAIIGYENPYEKWNDVKCSTEYYVLCKLTAVIKFS